MNVLSLCSGFGGLELGLDLIRSQTFRTVCYVEREAFAAANLGDKMEAGLLAEAPIWSDLRTFDSDRWRGLVDIVTAGFPCQPFSAAGKKKGMSDERWIWPDIARIIRDVQPRFVILENVPQIVTRGGLAVVLGDLAEIGFDAEWDLFSAEAVGASHKRQRIFVVAWDISNPDRESLRYLAERGQDSAQQTDARDTEPRYMGSELADRNRGGLEEFGAAHDNNRRNESRHEPNGCDAWPPGPNDVDGWYSYAGPKPSVCRSAYGGTWRVGELRLLGNGVVPLVAANAIVTLAKRALDG